MSQGSLNPNIRLTKDVPYIPITDGQSDTKVNTDIIKDRSKISIDKKKVTFLEGTRIQIGWLELIPTAIT